MSLSSTRLLTPCRIAGLGGLITDSPVGEVRIGGLEVIVGLAFYYGTVSVRSVEGREIHLLILDNTMTSSSLLHLARSYLADAKLSVQLGG